MVCMRLKKSIWDEEYIANNNPVLHCVELTVFLLKNNGIGNIIYESRSNTFEFSDKSADFKMYNNFCKIKACNKGI